MADEQPLENLIIVTSVHKEEYMTVQLVAQADWEGVIRKMALPGHYTHMFSLSKARVIDHDPKGSKVFSLLGLSMRSPYLKMEGLENQFRTSWLGKAPETIDDEIREINDLLQTVKAQSVATRFPVKETGTGT